ncbi:MAG: YlqF/YawG GTPase family protein, partial [Firmicutes bacterium]|nr:YlqF/YawG GTPase family protein [Bacillota bacterium]
MARGWYPGHMLLTQRVIRDLAPYLTGFLELADARAPLATRHGPLREWVGRTPRILILNKADLADPAVTRRWEAFFARGGEAGVLAAVSVSAREGEAARRRVQAAVEAVLKPPYRLAVVGMPNLGKSTLLNRMVGRRRTAVGARPGVTRGPQWIRMPGGWEWLDL